MQQYQIGVMLSGTRHDSEMFDIRANLDSSLHLGENLRNIRQQLGISTRNRGMEQMHQHSAEQQRERVRRKDTTRQTGRIQGTLGHHMDAMLQAQRPGKRISRTGHRYYERRENRSDKGRYL
jgi:N-methylhydantoinase B/oxoprolinase/acetone carboxylase alpha subunit